MKKIFLILILLPAIFSVYSQDADSIMIKKIYNDALSDKTGYENLRYLTKKIGGRVTGSPQAAAAVEWSKQVLQNMKPDTVWLQQMTVPTWIRGEKEICSVSSSIFGDCHLSICALGTSVGTGIDGLFGKVIEVKNFEELKNLGSKNVTGKIVFFNRAADPTFFYTFDAYGGVADQRVHGASEAAKYGAIGVIVRSLTLADDDFPHTGVMHYEKGIPQIPAIAVSTKGADFLSGWLKKDPQLNLFFRTTCRQDADGISFNVIAELKGSEFPDQIITLGGHIDSWDIGEGAHDDGAGIIQTMEVLRLYKKLGIKPKHTIRFVMFMDEEIAQSGARKYAEQVELKKEKLFFAVASDRGGTTPTAFSIKTDSISFNHVLKYRKYFEPYGIYHYLTDGSGVDIGPLKKFNIPLIVLVPDSQRYLDYHHAGNDTLENVNPRELQLGSASLASLIFLLDKYGFK